MGMSVMQVQHLLRVETPEQFNARVQHEHAKTRVLPPLHAKHVPVDAAT